MRVYISLATMCDGVFGDWFDVETVEDFKEAQKFLELDYELPAHEFYITAWREPNEKPQAFIEPINENNFESHIG